MGEVTGDQEIAATLVENEGGDQAHVPGSVVLSKKGARGQQNSANVEEFIDAAERRGARAFAPSGSGGQTTAFPEPTGPVPTVPDCSLHTVGVPLDPATTTRPSSDRGGEDGKKIPSSSPLASDGPRTISGATERRHGRWAREAGPWISSSDPMASMGSGEDLFPRDWYPHGGGSRHRKGPAPRRTSGVPELASPALEFEFHSQSVA
ncbi:hypothetical protein JHW43_003953 [Diplocarpon mali]|nr:hypothetical protein JHW43_003953 [Diplocarpon mali]